MAKGKSVSHAKSLKDMLQSLQSASERRAERERRLAQLAGKNFGDPAKVARFVERIRTEADSREFAVPRKRQLFQASGLLPSQGGPLLPALLDAAATERVGRSADVRVRDLLTGRANEKLACARGNRSWEDITYESLGRWGRQDVRQLARRRLGLTEGKRTRQTEIRRAVETVVSVIREIDGTVPGYTRDSINGEIRVPSLHLLQTAIELLIGPPVSLSAETSVKWLQKIRRQETLAPPRVATSSRCASSMLRLIPEAEREIIRADSARNLELLKKLGAQIPTRAIVASDNAELWARLDHQEE